VFMPASAGPASTSSNLPRLHTVQIVTRARSVSARRACEAAAIDTNRRRLGERRALPEAYPPRAARQKPPDSFRRMRSFIPRGDLSSGRSGEWIERSLIKLRRGMIVQVPGVVSDESRSMWRFEPESRPLLRVWYAFPGSNVIITAHDCLTGPWATTLKAAGPRERLWP